MQTLKVYSRRGCHLCEVLIEELLEMAGGRLKLQVCDIDSRPDWLAEFDTRVPVVEYRGNVICEYPLDRQAVAGLLDSLP